MRKLASIFFRRRAIARRAENPGSNPGDRTITSVQGRLNSATFKLYFKRVESSLDCFFSLLLHRFPSSKPVYFHSPTNIIRNTFDTSRTRKGEEFREEIRHSSMRQLIIDSIISLDGYYTDLNNSIDWFDFNTEE